MLANLRHLLEEKLHFFRVDFWPIGPGHTENAGVYFFRATSTRVVGPDLNHGFHDINRVWRLASRIRPTILTSHRSPARHMLSSQLHHRRIRWFHAERSQHLALLYQLL